ncbi:hypothetical protein N9A86_01400, partial [Akkermansiaceae bacterium]|nr:hypothetical protein [Akkermansiaceae bacterium]
QRTLKRFREMERVDPGFEFLTTAGFFESRGMVDEAARCLKKFFDAVRVSKNDEVSGWYQSAYSSAPRAAIIAMAREVQDFDLELDTAITVIDTCISMASRNGISRGSDAYEWLKVKLMDGADGRPALEVLKLLASFYGEPLLPVDEFEKVEKRFRAESLEGPDPGIGLKHLLKFAQVREHASDIRLYFDLLRDKNSPEEPSYEAWYLAMNGRYEEAAKRYLAAGLDGVSLRTGFLYRMGSVLKRSGHGKGEEDLAKARLYAQGEPSMLSFFAGVHSQMGEFEESQALYRAAMLRTERIDLQDSSDFRSLVFGITPPTLHFRDWRRVLAFYELESWLARRLGSDFYALQTRFQVLFCRGMLAAEEGRNDDAVKNLRAAHQLIPRSGVLADDFFPALREAGLIELHDELYQQSAELIRENIRFFQKDHNAKNTFGWLASRANRDLDEAEGYLKAALDVRPLSAAYLDTMAEIHFARGDREGAVKWSDRSADALITDSQILQQNRRFRTAPFPLK